MRLFTFNYKHDYAHGGMVVLADSYDDAVNIIYHSNKKTKVFKTMKDYIKAKVGWDDMILVFDKEVDIDESKIIYEYEDVC